MEIELSLLGTPSHHTNVHGLVQAFERRSSSRVKVVYHTWDTAWSNITRDQTKTPALAVSEAGTSWVSGLAGMDALVSVPPAVLKQLGGEKDYVPQSWKSCFQFGNSRMWAVPWVTGARVIYYRTDLLHQAKINPDTAFSTPQAMLETIQRLHQAGVTRPWVTSNVSSLNTLHLISSWIWASGSDFISADGRRLLFTSTQAIESMAAFFEMGRYMGPSRQEYSYDRAVDLFWSGEAAITMDGTWTYDAQRPTAALDVLDNLGIAQPPGPSFVGGSNLIVWANKIDAAPAWDLLLFMTEPDSVLTMFKLTGLAPAKLSLLNSREVLQRPFGPILNHAMETGRSLPNIRFSGLVEDNLHYAFGLVWSDILKSPHADLRDILTRHLVPLRERLEQAMKL
jgi:ABC-type glycerol-3-phosphate transport system substrate-binding protein